MFNTDFLAIQREAELEEFANLIPEGARVLELGGGTGQQARLLAARGVDIVSVDVAGSIYENERVFDVIRYDGSHLPFADATFDVVFSSNVLEHVADLPTLLDEMARVLVPGGFGLHAMPTHGWRFWTSVSHYANLVEMLLRCLPAFVPREYSFRETWRAPVRGLRRMAGTVYKGLVPERHGERGNVLTEIGYFHPAWWRRQFGASGWIVEKDRPMRLFYTGYMVLGGRLSLQARARLQRLLGAACQLYLVRPSRDRERAS